MSVSKTTTQGSCSTKGDDLNHLVNYLTTSFLQDSDSEIEREILNLMLLGVLESSEWDKTWLGVFGAIV